MSQTSTSLFSFALFVALAVGSCLAVDRLFPEPSLDPYSVLPRCSDPPVSPRRIVVEAPNKTCDGKCARFVYGAFHWNNSTNRAMNEHATTACIDDTVFERMRVVFYDDEHKAFADFYDIAPETVPWALEAFLEGAETAEHRADR